jgi:hypothetical protein
LESHGQKDLTILDVNGAWRRPHYQELHSFYRSTNKVRVIKSRRLRWAGHVPRIEEVSHTRDLVNSAHDRDYWRAFVK